MGLVKGKLMVSSFLRKIRATFSDLSPFLFHPARVFAASDHPTGRKSKIAPKTLGSGQCPFPLRPRGCDLWYGVLRDRVLSLVAGNLAGCNRTHPTAGVKNFKPVQIRLFAASLRTPPTGPVWPRHPAPL